jgi:hypothetical protein
MWVGALDTNGNSSASVDAPGGGFFPFSFRIGDYSTTVLDPSDPQDVLFGQRIHRARWQYRYLANAY